VLDPFILARSMHFAATILAAGTVCFTVLIAEPACCGARRPAWAMLQGRCTVMTWSALAAAAASGGTWLALFAAEIYGVPLIAVYRDDGLWEVLAGTRFGVLSIVRLILALALAAAVVSPALRWLQLAAAAALLGSLALIGHAGATPGAAGDLQLAADMVHLLAAGAWLGSLPGLALLLALPRPPKGLAAAATARFSILGMACAAALLATGIVNSCLLLGSPRDLVATSYGRLLSLKLGLFVALLGVAAVNKFHLTPRLSSSGARHLLARNCWVETGLGAGIVFLVGALGTLPPTAHRHFATAEIPPEAAFTHIHSEEAMAEVTIEPGRVGRADVSIRVMHEDSSPFPADRVRLVLEPPAPGPQKINRAAVRQPDGTWVVDGVTLGQPGNWIVQVIFPGPEGSDIVLDAPIVIAPAQ
jgi:putative copper resistance protein D